MKKDKVKIVLTKAEEDCLYSAYSYMYDEYRKAKRRRDPFYADQPQWLIPKLKAFQGFIKNKTTAGWRFKEL